MGKLRHSDDLTKTKYYFGTNDHDLVSLSNGDVLYITGAFSRRAVADKYTHVTFDPSLPGKFKTLPVGLTKTSRISVSQLREDPYFKATREYGQRSRLRKRGVGERK